MYDRPSRGFTLIEIAVVVALVAILLTAGAKIAGGFMEAAAVSVTQKKQQAIKEALVNYLNRNMRLPCPDTDRGNGPTLGFESGPPDGRENRTAEPPNNFHDRACAYPFGVVPYAELGLPQEAALDGWHNYFLYRVARINDYAWSKADEPKLTGSIVVRARNPDGEAVTIATGDNRAVFAIISVGRDGAGAFTVAGTRTLRPGPAARDERENTQLVEFPDPESPPNPVLWARDATDVDVPTGGPFNDIVLYVRPSDIRGSSIQQDFQDKTNRARLMILGRLYSNCELPQSTSDVGIKDQWGSPLGYRRIYNGTCNGGKYERPTSPRDAFELSYPGWPTSVVIGTDEVDGYLGSRCGCN
jgi:prepilin-type N-terminal cleavage/methylation domain-containing protein